ncbi:MAG: long-chain-fatty-acid--CoA ligase [Myxococcota bacterium]
MLGDLVRRTAKLHRELVLVVDDRRAVTAGALAAEVDALAAQLAGLGVGFADRVAVSSRNRIEVVTATFAAARLGAVVVPVNWRSKAREIRHVLEDACAKVVLFEPTLAAELAPVVTALPDVAAWVSLDPHALPWAITLDDVEPGPIPDVAVDEDNVVVQLYTSGTTGAPKGAMLTHRNLEAVVAAYLLEMHLAPQRSRFLQVTPLFHVGGLLMLLLCLASPCTIVLQPEFVPARVLAALADDGITHTLLVPAMLRWLLATPGIRDRTFPALALVGYGAAPMPADLLADATAVLRCDFVQGYGLTETAGVATALRPEDHRSGDPAILGSAGREIFGCEIRIVDADGVEVPCGQPGEIVVRGPNVTPGYYGRPDASADAVRGGWLHTGDIGRIDAAGYVTVVDRLKDMILVGGENVYPSEVEAVLRSHPAVADVAVVGIPHRVWGEEVLAVVVAGPDAPEDDGALEVAVIRHARAELAQFKCPTRVQRVAELPRNAAGKLMKDQIRRPFWDGRDRRV